MDNSLAFTVSRIILRHPFYGFTTFSTCDFSHERPINKRIQVVEQSLCGLTALGLKHIKGITVNLRVCGKTAVVYTGSFCLALSVELVYLFSRQVGKIMESIAVMLVE